MTVRGGDSAKYRILAMKERAEDLRPVWPKVGDIVAKVMAGQFQSAGTLLGRPWKPLNPEYRAWKIAHGFSGAILVKTGAMRKSFTSRPMGIEKYNKRSAHFGSDDPKAQYHQFGTTRGLPARPILFRQKGFSRAINEAIADWIIKGDT